MIQDRKDRELENKTLRVLSLGAGVQSSTVALMIHHKELPMVDCAIFADTKNEPDYVYDWLEYLKGIVSYPIHIVTRGDLKEDMLSNKLIRKLVRRVLLCVSVPTTIKYNPFIKR